MRPRQRHSAFEYPVVIKQVEGHLAVAVPDHNFFLLEKLPPRGRLDRKFLTKVMNAISKCWLHSNKRNQDFSDINRRAPSASGIREVLKGGSKRKIGIRAAADILGVSQQTVRRMADRKEVKCKVSEKGTRSFLLKDLIPHMKTTKFTSN